MSKMKHLLRKLHIGNNNNTNNPHNNQQQQPQQQHETTPSSSSSASSPPSTSSSNPTALDTSTPNVNNNINNNNNTSEENININLNNNNSARKRDYNNYMEEEFQVQLAMALSASDPEARECYDQHNKHKHKHKHDNDEDEQMIKAAKQLSLACSPSVPDDDDRLSEFLSLKYWNYNAVQYDEKVVDGFYDVYAIASSPIAQGEMPLLVDLQAISIFDDAEYEVVLVNRSVDNQLRQLENKVYAISVECRVLGEGLFLNDLIQRIANLVVDKLGGPVGDAEEMMKRWRMRTNLLKGSLNTIVLPIGSLNVGLSRHRALLFKVLADRINLPCMLVKGSLYTGTDEGAVNLIKFDDGSEYIIDLMGAPGTLIPAEVPSSLLLDTALEARGFSDSSAAVNNLSLVFDKVVGLEGTIPGLVKIPEVYGGYGTSLSAEAKNESTFSPESDLAERSQYDFVKSIRSEFNPSDGLPSPIEEASLAQEKKVKDVSKYVISAAKDPEFAQKLHAVLLESGASPPPDLFLDINPDIVAQKKSLQHVHPFGQDILVDSGLNNEMILLNPPGVQPMDYCDNRRQLGVDSAQQLNLDVKPLHSPLYPEPDNGNDGAVVEAHSMIMAVAAVDSLSEMPCHVESFRNSKGKVGNQVEVGEESSKMIDSSKRKCLGSCNAHSESVSPVSGDRASHMLGEFAEWEIPWEDLQIGERIGIGSYGEVYRADWNGTEVAVKKFLVQDFTSDVLYQFKCEADLMIRLRHPNVVLFMGAVSRPPNLSILTEFLPRGSLYRLLHRSGSRIDEKKRMKMALDVARGMNYLHTSNPTVVHRDLKSPNLLVDKNWVVKVCDFGLSRLKHHTFLSSNSTAGTPEWMAPEVLRNEPANEKCDVYSFGVILWELATLCVPWTGLNPMQVVGAVGFQNRRLEIPEEVDPMIGQIIRDCWENDPCLRPPFSQLISRLKGLKRLIVQRD